MKNIKLDSVLLFALVIPFIMSYRIGPGDTPYWLFGLIFLGLFFYLCLDLLKIKEKIYYFLKSLVLWFLIVGVIGGAFVSAIIVRHETHPIYKIHDIVIQQESAIRFLLDGKNPYSVNYFGTPLEQWHYSDLEENPALYHFVMEPFYLIFALPFYFLSNITFGYFDGRIPLLFLFFSLLILAWFLLKNNGKKLLFIILLAFNPAMLPYVLEGRSDIFMFAFLFAGLFLLHKKRFFWAGVLIALAFAVKQSVWPIFPFYLAFIYFKTKNLKDTLKSVLPFAITFILIILPFFLWDQKAFLDSTVFYLSGNVTHSYPISGYGLGALLNQFGFIKDVNQYYPFVIWQIIIGLPLMGYLIFYLMRNPVVSRLILIYGIFLFVFWYLSRYFNNSHLGYLSVVIISAYFWPNEDTKSSKTE
jgi:uncharacterized membrane protein